MKRLFVLSRYRGTGLGVKLVRSIIDEAAAKGYMTMRLDTIITLKEAMSIYESFGFTKIAPYYDSPVENAVYWELDLTQRSKAGIPWYSCFCTTLFLRNGVLPALLLL